MTMTSHGRRRWLLAGLGGLAAVAGSSLLSGCASRANTQAPVLDDARRSPAEGEFIARDGFSFVEFDWTDTARQRPVPVRLYLPSAADAGRQALPLILFSHGLGGSRRGYSYLGNHFARNGLASLHVQHVGSDRALWGGNPLAMAARLQAAARDAEALDRVADLRFALDRVLSWSASNRLRGRIDGERIVVAGHSYGANTALLASGARVQREGREFALRDERLRAAILISAPPFYGEGALEPILRPLRMPSLHITATGDDIQVPGYFSAYTDRIAVFDAIGSTRKALAVFAGGSHSIFTDRALTGGVELNPRVKAATQELTLAFVRSELDQRHDDLRDWPLRHRDILARFEPTSIG
jgi:predicted dienelactone hydrolase